MSAVAHLRTGFLAGALLYAFGQGCALLFQWLLLRHFGLQGYAEVGLAHLGLMTVLFLADLGYASLFLREHPAAPDWMTHWRQALGHRLLATLMLDLAWLGGVWWQARGQGEGFAYLLAVLPATLLGLLSYSAPLLAQGRRLAGFGVQQVAMPVALVTWWLLYQLPGWEGGAGAGLSISLGYLVQAIVNILMFKAPARLLWPQWGGLRMLGTALRLSALGIAGTLHDRLTPLLLAAVAPGFLSIYLFLGYLLNGLNGVFNQFNRLLLVDARSTAGELWSRRLVSLVLALSASGMQMLSLAATWGTAEQQAWLPWVMPVLAAGSAGLFGGVLAAILIGQHREHALLRVLFYGLLCSSLLQLTAAACQWPLLLLWGRLLGVLGMAMLSLRLCGLRLNVGGQAALLSMLLAAVPDGRFIAAVLLLPVAWALWRHRSLSRQVPEVSS